MAKDEHEAMFGGKAPEGGHSSPLGEKYEHWTGKTFTPGGEPAGQESADMRAFAEDCAGMQGKRNPRIEVVERERGDQSAKERPAETPWQGEDFDINQYDRGDKRVPRERKED